MTLFDVSQKISFNIIEAFNSLVFIIKLLMRILKTQSSK
jgi:hypothetical protein